MAEKNNLENYKKLSEYDYMKGMLNLTRQTNKKPSKLIQESTIPQLSPQEKDDEENKFKQVLLVSSRGGLGVEHLLHMKCHSTPVN